MALPAQFFGSLSPQCTRYSPLNRKFFSVNFIAPILAMRFSNGTEKVGGFCGVETTLEEGSKSSFKEVTILNPSLNRRVGRGPVRASSNCLPVEERERGERESDGAEAGEGSPAAHANREPRRRPSVTRAAGWR